ncbi:hypothetical protein F2Q69_00042081 [Brassica cretica]|uniref:Uncharacterized protein n=1 Tax=Brassica cretica TaxID=69181 RepID=A0A8S9NMU3_BRACR|nr:hypothetical protein F2Q69_00042081 [Brassica cretica]
MKQARQALEAKRRTVKAPVIFSSREFRPPEKLEMANLLSDEPTVNSIMTKVIIHVLNVQESIGLDAIVDDRFEVGRWTEVRSSLGSCKHKLRTPDVVGQKRFLLGIDLKNASTTTRLMTASSNKTPDMDSQSILPAATVGYTVHVPRRAEEVDEAMPSFENEEKRHIVT